MRGGVTAGEITDTRLGLNCIVVILSHSAFLLYPQLRIDGAQEWLRSRVKEVRSANADFLEYDWTFTTPYRGTTCSAELAVAGPCGRGLLLQTCEGRAAAEARWAPTDDTIDRHLLMARDPLLHYDEVKPGLRRSRPP